MPVICQFSLPLFFHQFTVERDLVPKAVDPFVSIFYIVALRTPGVCDHPFSFPICCLSARISVLYLILLLSPAFCPAFPTGLFLGSGPLASFFEASFCGCLIKLTLDAIPFVTKLFVAHCATQQTLSCSSLVWLSGGLQLGLVKP